MEMMIDESTRLIDLNLGQIADYFRSVIREEIGEEKANESGEFDLKSMKAISEHIGVAPSTLNEWKRKGYIDYAITRLGGRTWLGSSKRFDELRDLGLLGNPIMRNKKSIPSKYRE